LFIVLRFKTLILNFFNFYLNFYQYIIFKSNKRNKCTLFDFLLKNEMRYTGHFNSNIKQQPILILNKQIL